MKNKINTIISDVLDKYILRESSGVNFSVLNASKYIANDFVKNKMMEIYDEYKSMELEWMASNMDDSEDEDYDESNNPWYDLDYCYYIDGENEKEYRIEIFYEYNAERGQDKANTDRESIGINYYPIKQKIDKYVEMFGSSFNKHNVQESLNDDIYNYISPIIEHELTHMLDNEEISNPWISTYPSASIDINDVYLALYLYSDKEMNARIGSVGLIVQNALDAFSFGGENFRYIEQVLSSSKEFTDFVNDYILNDEDAIEELKIGEMKTVLNWISSYNDINSNEYNALSDYLSKSNGKPYSFAYYMYKNDERLGSPKTKEGRIVNGRRNIDYLFKTNFSYGEKAVYNFYKRLYDEYIKRIWKACYSALRNYVETYKTNDKN